MDDEQANGETQQAKSREVEVETVGQAGGVHAPCPRLQDEVRSNLFQRRLEPGLLGMQGKANQLCIGQGRNRGDVRYDLAGR